TSRIAQSVARQGGSTFQASMFSTVNMAWDVALTRDVSVPGEDAAKKLGACPIKWRKRSRRTSPVTFTNVLLAIQLATRQRILSPAIRPTSSAKAVHTPTAAVFGSARASTRTLIAYCVRIEHITAATTAARIAAWAFLRPSA